MRLSRSEIISIVGIAVTIVVFALDKLLDGYTVDATILNALSSVLPIIAIIVGIYTAIILARRLYKAVRKRTLQAAKATQSSVELKQALMTIRIDIKTMMYVLATRGDVYCIDWQWHSEGYLHQPFFEQFMIWETLDRSTIRLKATDLLKSVVIQNADVFEVVTEEAIRSYAVYDPNRQKRTSTHRVNNIDWWWYSTDPDMDQSKLFEEQFAKQGRNRSPLSALAERADDIEDED